MIIFFGFLAIAVAEQPINACIPDKEKWDCSYYIFIVDNPEFFKFLNPEDCDRNNENICLGLYQPRTHFIFILEGEETTRVTLGCSVLWHEMLHARGLSHEEMSLCPTK